MDQIVTTVESDLPDLTEMSLAALRTYDAPAMTGALARVLAETRNPSSSVGGDQS